MIFSILILAAVGGIAYFHYAQGFFSATLSTICAVLAAVLAVSYHEAVVTSMLGGKMADYANSIALVAIFGLVYILLRVLIDKTVPGNIRLPVIVDRVGGAAVGVIAGIFTAGVLALAGAALPFGPATYPRASLESREEVTIPPNPGQSIQTTADVKDQLTEDKLTRESRKGLWIPVDDLLLGAVQGLSNGGSLAGDRTLRSIHPSYADELFAQRLGIQAGASHVAMNLPGKSPQVTVPEPGIYRVDTDLNKGIVDAELPNLHQRAITKVEGVEPEDKMQLVIRLNFTQGASDPDRMVRLSPASVRLCANERNYYPVGTLENGLLFANKVDDFLLLNLKEKDGGADFVFMVNPDDVTSGNPKDKVQKINDDPAKPVFIEVKRLARVDLSGKEIHAGMPPPNPDNRIARKPLIAKDKKPAVQESAGSPAAAAPAAPFKYASISANKRIFSPINTGTPDKDVKGAQIPSGTLSMESRQFTQLDINTTQTLVVLKSGSHTVDELFEPTGKKLIQVVGTPPTEGGDPWAWGTLRNFTLVDAAGTAHNASGGWAQVKKDQQDRMVAKYDANATTPPDVSGTPDDGRPIKVWIAFLVPSGTHIKSLNYNGQPIAQMEQMVP